MFDNPRRKMVSTMKYLILFCITCGVQLNVHTLKISQTPAANYTNILYQYILLCGFDYICDPNSGLIPHLDLPLQPKVGFMNNYLCPKCSCDDACTSKRNCCPDLMFRYHEMSCMNFSLFDTRGTIGTGLVVSACPQGSEDHQHLCNGSYTAEDKFTLPPVTSNTHPGIVYRNQYCADCHDDNDTTEWNLKIDCPLVDLNHLSSYDEIYDVGYAARCEMGYELADFHRCSEYDSYDNAEISRCNKTGTWNQQDRDIEFACESALFLRYGLYRNVFCSICNPPPNLGDFVIDNCPKEEDHTIMHKACDIYPLNSASLPYKNIFCYHCNGERVNQNIITDVRTKFEDVITKGLHVKFSLEMLVDSFQTFPVHLYPESDVIEDKTILSKLFDVRSPIDGRIVETEKLLEIYILHYGNQGYCIDSILPEYSQFVSYRKPCSCDLSCVLNKKCCLDLALTDPINFIQQRNAMFLTVNNCYHFHNKTIHKKCLSVDQTDGRTLYPTISKWTGIPYKNIYCQVCNEMYRDDVSSNSHDSFLTLRLTCDFVLPWRRFVSVEDLMEFVESTTRNCVWTWGPSSSSNNGVSTVKQPSSTKSCTDPDLDWACNHFNSEISYFSSKYTGPYRNVFCDICYKADVEFEFTECNMTGGWGYNDTQYSAACLEFPSVASMSPFKNFFCKECNPELKELSFYLDALTPDFRECLCDYQIDYFKETETKSKILQNTYRSIFSTKIHRRDRSNLIEDLDDCHDNETMDFEKDYCIPLVCSSGKYIEGKECLPYLTKANRMGFSFVTGLSGFIVPTALTTTATVLSYLQKVFQLYIAERVSSELEVISNIAEIKRGCSSIYQTNMTTGIEMYIHITFYVIHISDRNQMEGELTALLNESFSFLSDDFSIDIAAFSSPRARMLPFFALEVDSSFENSCFKSYHDEFEYNDNSFKISLITHLLTCQQVELTSERFEYDRLEQTLFLKPHGPTLSLEKFRLHSGDTVHICTEDFRQMMNNYFSNKTNILSYIIGVASLTLVSLSMFCLFLTLCTYIFFAQLRTLPGRNNMCLVVALFMSQGLTQFGLNQTGSTTLCTILSICMHYFWLVTFFCMNVCSFHMFKVFVISFSSVKDKIEENWSLFRYICYSFGTPIVIIIINITLTYSLQSHTGYGDSFRCFMTQSAAVIGAFVVPILILCCSNIVFFSVTAHKIRKAPSVASSKNNRRDFSVYIKLFALTGITWIAQIVDSFLPQSVFSVLVSVLNASQGIFIFCSYSLNERVRGYYRKGLTRTLTTSSPSSSKYKNSSVDETTSNDK